MPLPLIFKSNRFHMINKLQFLAFCLVILLSFPCLNSCSDKDNPVLTSGVMTFDNDTRTLVLDENTLKTEVSFVSRQNWTITIEQSGNWLTVTPDHGAGGMATVVFTGSLNQTGVSRSAKVIFKAAEQTEEFSITQNASSIEILTPESIKDYERYYKPQEFSGMDMFRSDSKWSWTRMRQSEHFFVFWDKYFGDDPNGSHLAAGDRVDIDDLLAKAEQFFETNINKLGMSSLGNGTSVLDDYKMEIYLLDPTPEWWVATGSGYDDMIGALWITPSTCQPVGSTIAHEIGHSFQYQTYADRVRKQDASNDFKTGFRYGFVGPDGSGNGGCGYWEQCAQWQAHQDYPREQFESYDYDVWLNNYHRHFHHEWQRYASYWLQSYWVEKHGVEAYGRIWKESRAPEDAISAYTRLFNSNDYSVTREELFDYALRMATYDIDGVREYADGYQDRYRTKFFKDKATGEYQISYANCPGATGFNVIALQVPANGGTVSVDFRGLGYGASLSEKDKGGMVDGDGVTVGTASNYNAVGGAENMGWRYGFVAMSGQKRTYSEVGKNAQGNLGFDVPSGTELLYLVVQGSPEIYMSHGWDEVEANDPQFPYIIKLNGTDLVYYEEDIEPEYNLIDEYNLNVSVSIKLTPPGVYGRGSIDLGSQEICDFFGLSRSEISNLIKVASEPEEGIISCRSLNSDGSWNMNASANNGYWLNAKGDEGQWVGGYVFFEIAGTDLNYGDHPEQITEGYTGSFSMRPVFTYTKGGKAYTLKFNISLNY